MPSDCAGACACDCRASDPSIRAIENKLDKLKEENDKLKEENRKLKSKVAELTEYRETIINKLSAKLQELLK